MSQNNNITAERKLKHLSEKERYKIEALSQRGVRPSEIARHLGRNRRTIEREIKRGSVIQRDGEWRDRLVYCADAGQRVSEERAANKGRGLKIGHDHRLAQYIEDKIKNEKWSPDAIIGKIKEQGLVFEESICTKTVYNYIDRGLFLGISNKDLWIKKDGKKRDYKKIRTVALNNKNGRSITERPREANERAERGHWEIDLVIGKQGTKPAIMTLVDRKTRKSIYVLVKNKTQKEVVAAIKRARHRVGGNFEDVIKTITADNGSEFLDSEAIKKAAKCGEVYYAHPYSSWERGSNENSNRMLRRFVPKGTDIGKMTQKELKRIEDWVNNYPRKLFGYKTANEMSA